MSSTAEKLVAGLAAAADQDTAFIRDIIERAPGGEQQQFEALVGLGILREDECYKVWAEVMGMPYHALDDRSLDANLLQLLPLDVAKRYSAVAIHRDEGVLDVALRNPFDILAVDAIQEVTGLAVQVFMSTPTAIGRALARQARSLTGIEGLIARIHKSEIDLNAVDDAQKLRQIVGDDAVVQLVDYLIEEAMRAQASDIHVEPQRKSLRVRIRVDGGLDTLHRFPFGLHRAVCSRLKVMAGMDIAESRKPQDGRFIVDEGVEMRVSTLPTVLGEKVVMRILDRQGMNCDPEALGMSVQNLRRFRQGYMRPNGLVLLTGPTGSGKTTTLYAAMHELNREDRNLITVEDPVEYELEGATQVQVDTKADRTFAKALRSMLRQDPDIIMIGEIRDAETAAIAVQAALTGHLVLSTLHTNDAIAAVHRLIDMGVAPYLLGPALRCIVGQRLVSRLCAVCAEPAEVAAELVAACGVSDPSSLVGLRRASGCKHCGGKGRRGRIAVHEVVLFDRELSRLVSRNADETEVTAAAAATGYEPMLVDGVTKACAGVVALEDVLAVAPSAAPV